MTAKDWIDHRTEPLAPGELPVAVKRMIAIESDDYAVYADYGIHEIPVIEHANTLNVYVPDTLLDLAPISDAEIEAKLDRNAERGTRVAVHPYDGEPEAAL